MNAQVMELVYVLVLEAKFCEFESRPGHQVFVAVVVTGLDRFVFAD